MSRIAKDLQLTALINWKYDYFRPISAAQLVNTYIRTRPLWWDSEPDCVHRLNTTYKSDIHISVITMTEGRILNKMTHIYNNYCSSFKKQTLTGADRETIRTPLAQFLSCAKYPTLNVHLVETRQARLSYRSTWCVQIRRATESRVCEWAVYFYSVWERMLFLTAILRL